VTAAVVWFRRDLRLVDNPAWAAATASHERVTALFVLDPVVLGRAGPIRHTQLLAHLRALDGELADRGGRLLVRCGRPVDVVGAIGAQAVYVNADVSPYARRRDDAVRARLGDRFRASWGGFVHPPGTTSRVFTPFYRRWTQRTWEPWPEPGDATITADPGDGLPTDNAKPFQTGGEQAAWDRLTAFERRVDDYPDGLDTSVLSADLHFGTLSPRAVVALVGEATPGRTRFTRQLAWRDWFAHLLWDQPSLIDTALRPKMDQVPWINDPADIAAWKEGRTGYPIVDAGMRQLVTTGWMPNRVRMIVGSFLVKDLLVDWRIGERWFRTRLVDGDVAQNVGNWQWVAGTGPDAAPFFRIFNPVLQSEKFDPEGSYIRRHVPELARVPTKWIHAPWTAPSLAGAYPGPIVDHPTARERALAAYGAAR
jgi:deoxyribodipyrimidine photo-lyase